MNRKKRWPIAREGFPWIFLALGGGFLLFLMGSKVWVLIFLILAGGIAFFFRDPERSVPHQADVIISPADGKIVDIQRVEDRTFPGGEAVCVSIFLSIFNVHINRSPIAGQVVHTRYHTGRFLPAFRKKASHLNEQNIILIENGPLRVQVRQIAGQIARRIVCWIKEGDMLLRGDRVGLIKFGSRVDLLLPPNVCQVVVGRGDKVRGGETVIARVSHGNGKG